MPANPANTALAPTPSLAPAPAPEQLVEVMIKRDRWEADETGEIIRHRAGTIVSLPVEAALEGIESGVLGRVKK